MTPTKHDIEQAHERIKPFIHSTPVLTNQFINELAGCEVFFKAENFQKIGAFKARGGLNAALSLSPVQLKKGLCTHSSGNHAQAIAFAAKMLGTKAYIVMPKTATKVKVDAVKGYGAEVIFCEPNQKAREETVKTVQQNTGAEFIHPYNHLKVIEGQATAAKELLEEIPNLNTLFVPVGGGGLFSGTCLSAAYFGNQVDVYAGEPELVNDAFLSLEKGEIVPATGKVTVADGLMTSLGDITFAILQKHAAGIFTVSEAEIVAATRLIWERMKIIVEPSSAVPLAALLKHKEAFVGKKIGIVLSGGNVDLGNLPF